MMLHVLLCTTNTVKHILNIIRKMLLELDLSIVCPQSIFNYSHILTYIFVNTYYLSIYIRSNKTNDHFNN